MSINFSSFIDRLARKPAAVVREERIAGSSPGIEIAYELHRPAAEFSDLLVFIHGGGADRRSGYDQMAEALVQMAAVAVCLPDLRGHGTSDGRRGHVEAPHLAWRDIDGLMAALRVAFPGVRLHMGGHSSGVGFILNLLTRGSPTVRPDTLVMLAPELGFRAGLYRDGSKYGPFARVSLWPFLLNAFTGGRWGGGLEAVVFDYGSARRDRGLSAYTVGMANAVTPSDPVGQLAALRIPTQVALAADDELIDAQRARAFIEAHSGPSLTCTTLPQTRHLDIIIDAVPFLATSIMMRPGERA